MTAPVKPSGLADALAAIKARLEKKGARLEGKKREIAQLERELADLKTTERVLLGLDAVPEISPKGASSADTKPARVAYRGTAGVPDERRGRRGPRPKKRLAPTAIPKRPERLPSYPDMIMEALRYAADKKVIGFEPNEITAFIRRRYWVGVQHESIAPTVWYLWKQSRVEKYGEVYTFPGESPPGEPETDKLRLLTDRARRQAALDEVTQAPTFVGEVEAAQS